jgi:hypothetical protein
VSKEEYNVEAAANTEAALPKGSTLLAEANAAVRDEWEAENTHTHTHTHTCMHTHIHTHTHINMHTITRTQTISNGNNNKKLEKEQWGRMRIRMLKYVAHIHC